MTFASQSEAKSFFVQRILTQAEREGVRLSKAEHHMLSWSESDPDFKSDEKLATEFEDETTDEEFEAKIAGLIKRAYAQDVSTDKTMKAAYREAYSKLREGDHYILVIIDRALSSKLKKWWPF